MTTKILTWAFYILFFTLPLIFFDKNSELFEYNKMMAVYAFTTLIVTTWLIRMLSTKTFLFKKTPLDIPLGLFLISQILSTIFSIDPHTSIWGYYSRSNGGLLSIISYILLFYALVSNFDLKQALKFLKVSLFGGLVVALWAIPEHFGASPSCALLVSEFSDSCWVQDVQARVFATLGQPNWLAAYMEMLIFPAFYFFLDCRGWMQRFWYITLILFYMAFTFTYSRGAMLGLIVGMIIFGIGYYLSLGTLVKKSQTNLRAISRWMMAFILVIVAYIVINLLFGSSLTGDFRLLKSGTPARPGISSAASVGTQLENGGTESGQIRLIVWKGAFEIFKHYPIFGSGVETFAYSYYNFRPVEHNMVSEWDFLYNKAHNEYLNYLATTGIVGFLSYMSIIVWFIYWSIKKIIAPSKDSSGKMMNVAILASYLAYLIQDFFGFSVVAIAVLFFVFPAFSFLANGEIKNWKFKNNFIIHFFDTVLYKRPTYRNIISVLLIVIALTIFYKLGNYWNADILYKNGSDDSDAGSVGKAFNELTDAVYLNPDEPLYHSELAYSAAASAVATNDTDATQSAFLKEQAIYENNIALSISPKNVSLWRTAIRTNYEISIIDPTYEQKTLDTFDTTISLAPTDPKLEYNKALILEQQKKYDEAIATDQKAIQLKSDYPDAIFKLGELYQEKGDIPNAKIQIEKLLQQIPNQPDALKKLDELNGKK